MVEKLLDEKQKEYLEILSWAKKNPQEIESLVEGDKQLRNAYEKLQLEVKELSQDLATTKNYLHNILESLITGVVVVDQEERITTFNKNAGIMTGFDPNNCLGKKLKEVFPADLFEKALAPLIHSEQKAQSLDRVLIARDQREVHVRISASPVLENGGEKIGTALSFQDVTRLKRLEEEVQRNQRLKAMGEMAAGIAHEIRNPLGSIELFASLLKKDLKGDEEKELIAEHICSGVKNMDRIISTLLLFAKSPEPSRQKCEINSLLDELLEFSSNIIFPGNIKIVRKFSPGELLGNGDGDLLRQVLLNLIRNAIQAMPDGGELCITSKVSMEPKSAKHPEKDRRRFISITVSDTGTGISSANLVKIFNPFFTTRDRGTGLGLAIAHNIIKAHQGTIEVESRLGKGTAFIVKIPAWEQ